MGGSAQSDSRSPFGPFPLLILASGAAVLRCFTVLTPGRTPWTSTRSLRLDLQRLLYITLFLPLGKWKPSTFATARSVGSACIKVYLEQKNNKEGKEKNLKRSECLLRFSRGNG